MSLCMCVVFQKGINPCLYLFFQALLFLCFKNIACLLFALDEIIN